MSNSANCLIYLTDLKRDHAVFPEQLQDIILKLEPIPPIYYYVLCLVHLRNYYKADVERMEKVTREYHGKPDDESHQIFVDSIKESLYGQQCAFQRYIKLLERYV